VVALRRVRLFGGFDVSSWREFRWGVVVLLPVPYSPRRNAWLEPRLSVASEASRKSLKAFKEQGKTLKALLEGVYQGKKHLQELALEGALSLMSRVHCQRCNHNCAKIVSILWLHDGPSFTTLPS
jgi:hypothetical protein